MFKNAILKYNSKAKGYHFVKCFESAGKFSLVTDQKRKLKNDICFSKS